VSNEFVILDNGGRRAGVRGRAPPINRSGVRGRPFYIMALTLKSAIFLNGEQCAKFE